MTAPMLIYDTQWNDRLAFDVALMMEGSGETLQEVATRHKVTKQDLLRFKADSMFVKKVDAFRTDVREKGLTFRVKARAQAEELLTTSWTLIHDQEVAASVKADLIKSTVKWAGLEVKDAGESTGGSNAVQININLG